MLPCLMQDLCVCHLQAHPGKVTRTAQEPSLAMKKRSPSIRPMPLRITTLASFTQHRERC